MRFDQIEIGDFFVECYPQFGTARILQKKSLSTAYIFRVVSPSGHIELRAILRSAEPPAKFSRATRILKIE
jgi:hypothetical protein